MSQNRPAGRPDGLASPDNELLARLTAIVGPAHALADPDQKLPFLREPRGTYEGRTPLVLRPGSTDEVAQIMALAHEHKIGVVPQSGNTGLVGGQIPDRTGRQILLSLARLNAVRRIDTAGAYMICEAGLTLDTAQAAARDAGLDFALDLPSRGTCCIGGNLSTNAGGVNVLAYGNARAQVLGLEVVLADGRIWHGLSALKKDNTGYDLKNLFIGAEGTLGIITAACLKLVPLAREQATALVALDDLDRVLPFFMAARETAGPALTAFELMARRCLDFVIRHGADMRDPLAEAHPWYVLIELSALHDDGAAEALLERILAAAFDSGKIADAAIAGSPRQAHGLWGLRENISECQKPEGGSLKHDISVPVAHIGTFITRAGALAERLCPGIRPVPFGHFGDGNIHYNLSQPKDMDKQAFLARHEEISQAVYNLVMEFDGSISAEHGIGVLKRDQLQAVKSDVELDLMRAIKTALDPDGILNPGKVLPERVQERGTDG